MRFRPLYRRCKHYSALTGAPRYLSAFLITIIAFTATIFCSHSARGAESSTLEFPKFKPVGDLYLVDPTDSCGKVNVKWSPYKLAQGTVTKPTNASLALLLRYDGTTGFSWMDKLQPDALTIIDTRHMPIGAEQFKHVAQLTGLKRLDVDGTDIGDKELSSLQNLRNLVYLNVSHTLITGASFNILKNFKNLASLHASHDKLQSSSLASLQYLPHLASVQLDDTNLDDRALLDLSKAGSLRQIMLSENAKITDAGIESLSKLPELQNLGVADCHLTRKCFTGLAKMKKLRCLRIYSNDLSKDDLQELRVMLKNCTLATTRSKFSPELFSPLH